MAQPRSLRNTVVFGPILQLMLVLARMVPPGIPAPLWYMIFLSIIGLHVYFYERDNPSAKRVLDTRQYSLLHAPPQVEAGFLIGLAIAAPIALLGRFSLEDVTLGEFLFQAVIVSFVETVYIVVFVETVPYGVVLIPIFFGFLHVADSLLAGDYSWTVLGRFTLSAFFGLLFWFLYAARSMRLGKRSRYFGAVTSQVAHLTYNMIVLLFPLTILGMQVFPP